jgi:hypothetical protein
MDGVGTTSSRPDPAVNSREVWLPEPLRLPWPGYFGSVASEVKVDPAAPDPGSLTERTNQPLRSNWSRRQSAPDYLDASVCTDDRPRNARRSVRRKLLSVSNKKPHPSHLTLRLQNCCTAPAMSDGARA